jgi:hypothetical protein
VLGERPAQAPPGMADRWIVAGTLNTDPYPRYIPRRRGGATTDPNARVGDLAPCERCGGQALMRHPVTGAPCHKDCVKATAEIAMDDADPDEDVSDDL